MAAEAQKTQPAVVTQLIDDVKKDSGIELSPVAALTALHVAGMPFTCEGQRKGKLKYVSRAKKWLEDLRTDDLDTFVKRAQLRESICLAEFMGDEKVQAELASPDLTAIKDQASINETQEKAVRLHRFATPLTLSGLRADVRLGPESSVVVSDQLGISVNWVSDSVENDAVKVLDAHRVLFMARYKGIIIKASDGEYEDAKELVEAGLTYKACFDIMRSGSMPFLMPCCFERVGVPILRPGMKAVMAKAASDVDGFRHMLLQHTKATDVCELGAVAMCVDDDMWAGCRFFFKMMGSAVVSWESFEPPRDTDPVLREAWLVLGEMLEEGVLSARPDLAFDAALFVVSLGRRQQDELLPLAGRLLDIVQLGLDNMCGDPSMQDWRLREHVRSETLKAEDEAGLNFVVYGNLDATNYRGQAAARYDSSLNRVRAASPVGIAPGSSRSGSSQAGRSVGDPDAADPLEGVFSIHAGGTRVEVEASMIVRREPRDLEPMPPDDLIRALKFGDKQFFDTLMNSACQETVTRAQFSNLMTQLEGKNPGGGVFARAAEHLSASEGVRLVPTAASMKLVVQNLEASHARKLNELAEASPEVADAMVALACFLARLDGEDCGPLASVALASAIGVCGRAPTRVVSPSVETPVHIGVVDLSVMTVPQVGVRATHHNVHGAIETLRDSVWRIPASFMAWFVCPSRRFGLCDALQRECGAVPFDDATRWAKELRAAAAPLFKAKGVRLVEQDVAVKASESGAESRTQPGWAAGRGSAYMVLLCWDAKLFSLAAAAATRALSRLEVMREQPAEFACTMSVRRGRARETQL